MRRTIIWIALWLLATVGVLAQDGEYRRKPPYQTPYPFGTCTVAGIRLRVEQNFGLGLNREMRLTLLDKRYLSDQEAKQLCDWAGGEVYQRSPTRFTGGPYEVNDYVGISIGIRNCQGEHIVSARNNNVALTWTDEGVPAGGFPVRSVEINRSTADCGIQNMSLSQERSDRERAASIQREKTRRRQQEEARAAAERARVLQREREQQALATLRRKKDLVLQHCGGLAARYIQLCERGDITGAVAMSDSNVETHYHRGQSTPEEAARLLMRGLANRTPTTRRRGSVSDDLNYCGINVELAEGGDIRIEFRKLKGGRWFVTGVMGHWS